MEKPKIQFLSIIVTMRNGIPRRNISSAMGHVAHVQLTHMDPNNFHGTRKKNSISRFVNFKFERCDLQFSMGKILIFVKLSMFLFLAGHGPRACDGQHQNVNVCDSLHFGIAQNDVDDQSIPA